MMDMAGLSRRMTPPFCLILGADEKIKIKMKIFQKTY